MGELRVVVDTCALYNPQASPAKTTLLYLLSDNRLVHLVTTSPIIQEYFYTKTASPYMEFSFMAYGLIIPFQHVEVLYGNSLAGLPAIKADESDRKFPVAAISGAVNWLISEDSHLTRHKGLKRHLYDRGIGVTGVEGFLRVHRLDRIQWARRDSNPRPHP